MFDYPQDITYWAPAGEDQFGAESYDDPIVIKGRWEDRQDQARAATGEEFTTQAIVYVDRDLAIGGRLKEGDVSIISDPILGGGQEIRGWATIPDIRNASKERKALL